MTWLDIHEGRVSDMRTWWILRHPANSEVLVEHAHEGSYLVNLFRKAGVGPFWSHEEAQRVLEHWTK